MTRYVIVGAGAVGATLGAQLHLAGRDVVLIARGAHLEALKRKGLRYIRPDGERQLHLDAAPTVGLRDEDILVLATKSQDTEAALQHWAWQPVSGVEARQSAAEALPIVLLQNGLANATAALRRFDTVLDAVILVPSSHLEPGVVVAPAAPTVGAVYVGLASRGGAQVLDTVARDFTAAAFPTQRVTDIARWKAGKLLGNLAHNLDVVYPPSPLRDVAAAALVAEARSAFAAAGIDAADLLGENTLDLSGLVGRPVPGWERGGSSTWQSIARSAGVESDFLNGEISLIARLHGVPAPLNIGIQRRIARMARDGLAPASFDQNDLLALLEQAGVNTPHAAVRPAHTLVDAKELQRELHSPRPPLLLDVRWALGDPHGRAHYEAGHLPDAVYVDLDTELAGPPTPEGGRHPIPALDHLERSARSWGVRSDVPVVVYDDTGGQAAARAWWLLRWAGVEDVRVLDGGLGAWRELGFDISVGEHRAPRGNIALTSGALPALTADEAAELARSGVLLDARTAVRYRGEQEPVDPIAGHIPGARNAPTAETLDDTGAFRPPAQIREHFARLGADGSRPVGVYCGSGVTAAHTLLALSVAGVPAALYPGSWSAWISDPERPVATGPDEPDDL